jgi:hypothetical protein
MRITCVLLTLLPLIAGATPANERVITPPGPMVSEEPLAIGGRVGKSFTPKGKQIVKQRNASANDGKNRCETCGVETVPAKQHEKGVTPPANETHVDHKVPKSKDGEGEPPNGQVLCRKCNLEKSDKTGASNKTNKAP